MRNSGRGNSKGRNRSGSRDENKRGDRRESGQKRFSPRTRAEQGRSEAPTGRPSRPSKGKPKAPKYNDSGLIRLNKYIANAGVCSRREADTLISSGVVTVNGKVVTELGTKVKSTDTVKFGEQSLSLERKQYVLLNKPKDFITTVDDPRNRKTVMQLVRNACKERIFPVGRLDRNTTGVLLFTNDGDLAKILTHPSHENKKIYHVFTDRAVKDEHIKQLLDGVTLDDGYVIKADEAHRVGDSSHQVGVELHSGRYHVVRRMFDALGYEVKKLDRVYFAGLNKKDLKRGQWRFLNEQEIMMLKRTAKAGTRS